MEMKKVDVDGIPVWLPFDVDAAKNEAMKEVLRTIPFEAEERAKDASIEMVEAQFEALKQEIVKLHIDCSKDEQLEYRTNWEEGEPRAVPREVEMLVRGFFAGINAYGEELRRQMEMHEGDQIPHWLTEGDTES